MVRSRTPISYRPADSRQDLEFSGFYATNGELATDTPINSMFGASITYRISTGSREGQKVFTLQTLPAESEEPI